MRSALRCNWLLLGLMILAGAIGAWASDAKASAEDLVLRHLEALGSAEARQAAKSRVAEGRVQFSEVISGKVRLAGSALVLSQGDKFKCAMKFGVPQYSGEQWVFDGKTAQVAMTDPGTRSILGQYLFSQSEILKEGLLGGTVTTSWPLLDLQAKQAKVKYEGTKKIGGRELHELTYIPKKRGGNGELLIRLYLEPETYRHVLSIYRLTLHHQGGSIAAGTDETVETVEERFSEFRAVDGLTMPAHWEIRYRKEPGKPSELLWNVVLDKIMNNAIN